MSDPQHPSGSFFPPPPPVRPNVADYVKAFNKPLTTDEKAAWLAEIAHLVLQGVLPQEVYPALKDHIEALPIITASKDRPEEKLPGSDYVYPGPPKPLKPLTTVFPDAESMHVFEQRPATRAQRKSDSSTGVFLFVCLLFILGFIAYGIGLWTMNSTKLIRETPQPIERVAFGEPDKNTTTKRTETFSDAKPTVLLENPFENPGQIATHSLRLENPFDDPTLAKEPLAPRSPNMKLGPELLHVSTFLNGYRPEWRDNDWHWQQQHQGQRLGTAENRQGVLRLDVRNVMGDGGLPQLFYEPLPITKGKQYRIEIEMRCEKEGAVVMQVDSLPNNTAPQWRGFGRWELQAEKSWKKYQYDFKANDTASNARLHFARFEADKVYELRRVSVQEILP